VLHYKLKLLQSITKKECFCLENVINGQPFVQAHEAANTLVKNGFKDVWVLQEGIFNIVWTAASVKPGYCLF